MVSRRDRIQEARRSGRLRLHLIPGAKREDIAPMAFRSEEQSMSGNPCPVDISVKPEVTPFFDAVTNTIS